MSDEYTCHRCGDMFEMKATLKNHLHECQISKLDQYMNKGFFNLDKAIKSNDYDKNINVDNSTQRTLRNKVVNTKQTTL